MAVRGLPGPGGHHSIKLTVDVYGHLIPGTNRQAVDRLDDATIRNPRATGDPVPTADDKSGAVLDAEPVISP